MLGSTGFFVFDVTCEIDGVPRELPKQKKHSHTMAVLEIYNFIILLIKQCTS